MAYQGRCRCAALGFSVELPQPLADYHPRACDCEYCTRDGVAWLSDSAGRLVITAMGEVSEETQGSGQARFLRCASCRSMVAVTLTHYGEMIGAFNARLLDDRPQLGGEESASPRLLEPGEKAERWASIWMPTELRFRGKA